MKHGRPLNELETFTTSIHTNPYLKNCLEQEWQQADQMEKRCRKPFDLGMVDDAGRSVAECISAQESALIGIAIGSGKHSTLDDKISEIVDSGIQEGKHACFYHFEAKRDMKKSKKQCEHAVDEQLKETKSCLYRYRKSITK